MPSAAEIYLERLLKAMYPGGDESAMIMLDFPHFESHVGDTYLCSYKSADGADVADNGNISILLRVGDIHAHVIASLAAGGDSEYYLYENTVVSGNGTPLSLVNKRRDSPNTPLSTAYHTPTVTGVGFPLINALVPGGTGGNAQGSSEDHANEWILKPGLVYMFRLYNRAGNTQPLGLVVEFYEHLLP